MTIVVEDGSGLPAAVSYASVAFADAFHAARNNFNWAGDTPTKEGALIRATDYMVQVYRRRWLGQRLQYNQALDWPRIGVVVEDINQFVNDTEFYGNIQSNVVPIEVQQACALLALRAITFDDNGNPFDLAPDLDRATKSERVGSVAVEYVTGTPDFLRYRAIDNLLNIYLNGGTTGLRLVRA